MVAETSSKPAGSKPSGEGKPAEGDGGSKPDKPSGAAAAGKPDATALSMQSGMSSSLVETSEDEEAKRKEAEKAAKSAKKGLDEKELDKDVDVVIEETETIFLLHMPSQVVAA